MFRSLVFISLSAGVLGVQQEPVERVVTLPGVEQVLAKANGKVQEFSATAKAMEQAIAKEQTMGRLSLVKKKREYEAMIARQAWANRNMSLLNSEIHRGNDALRRSNRALEAALRDLQRENDHGRKILQRIGEKVGIAGLFIEDSLEITEDAKAMDLQVLAPTTPLPSLEVFLAEAQDMNPSALLQLPDEHAGSDTPRGMVDVLANSLEDIRSAEKQGEAELKQNFERDFEVGVHRQAALNETQGRLLATRNELQQREAKLYQAKAHLEATRQHLQDRLHALRIFASTLESALAEIDEPSAVAMPSDAKERVQANVSTGHTTPLSANRTHKDSLQVVDTEEGASSKGVAKANSTDVAMAHETLPLEEKTQTSMYMAAAAAAAAAASHKPIELDQRRAFRKRGNLTNLTNLTLGNWLAYLR